MGHGSLALDLGLARAARMGRDVEIGCLRSRNLCGVAFVFLCACFSALLLV